MIGTVSRLNLIGVALCCLATTVACAQVKAIDESDFVVRRVEDGKEVPWAAPLQEVLSDLGQPLDIKVSRAPGKELGFVQYIYAGLVIGSYEGDNRITLLRITGKQFTTARGISIGASRNEIEKAFGPTRYQWPTVLQYHLTDTSTRLGSDRLISFWIEKGIVNGIDINAAP